MEYILQLLNNLIHMTGSEWLSAITTIITKILVIALIIFIGFLFKKTITMVTDKICTLTKITPITCSIINTLLSAITITMVIALILIHFGVDLPSLTAIEHKIAALGVSGVLLTLILKNPVENFFAAHMIIRDRKFHIGDYIQSKDKNKEWEGKVINIDKRYTTLQHKDQTIIIPNATLYSSEIGIIPANKKINNPNKKQG